MTAATLDCTLGTTSIASDLTLVHPVSAVRPETLVTFAEAYCLMRKIVSVESAADTAGAVEIERCQQRLLAAYEQAILVLTATPLLDELPGMQDHRFLLWDANVKAAVNAHLSIFGEEASIVRPGI